MRTAWALVLLGLLATLTMPVAIFTTRYSGGYDLVHAAFAIPVALVLGVAAIVAVRRERRAQAASLRRDGDRRGVGLGWALGVAGIALAASAGVAVAVYGLLTYLGERGT